MARQITVVLDDDAARLLDEETRRSGVPIDKTVSEAVREKLQSPVPKTREPFRVQAFDMGEPMIDLECTSRALQLLDELEGRDRR